jgi:hypothetical protein
MVYVSLIGATSCAKLFDLDSLYRARRLAWSLKTHRFGQVSVWALTGVGACGGTH